MASEEIVRTTDCEAGEIAHQAMSGALEFRPLDASMELDIDSATKIPFAELAALGVAFAPLVRAFEGAGTSEVLLRATDHLGNTIDPSKLFRFKDYPGYMGSYMEAGELHQAELHQVIAGGTQIFQPELLLIAAATVEINKKLDAIQETQKEMFQYLKNRDKSALRADLDTLSEILDNYQFNCSNPQFKSHKHILVQDIRNRAAGAIKQHRAQIFSALKKGGFLKIDKDVRSKTAAVKEELNEYRVAVYVYGFSSFLEIMLLENFDPSYISATGQRISDEALTYRELYTHIYDVLEGEASSSVRAAVFKGISAVAHKAGEAIASTPIGDKTQIDETLDSLGSNLGNFNSSLEREMLGSLVEACSTEVLPFVASLNAVNRLYNRPSLLLADAEAVYILPNTPPDAVNGYANETVGEEEHQLNAVQDRRVLKTL